MDPLYNNNPTPTPAPKPTPAPNAMPNIAIAGSAPAPNPAPNPAVNPAPAPAPAPEPAAPAPAPVAPEPMFEPPMPPVPPMPPMQDPSEPTVPAPTMEEIPAASMSFENAFANSTTPIDSSAYGLDATEPVVQPGVEEVRDPVAEALAAPIKAADPVPGSIGSAFSMPEAPAATPAEMGASVSTTPVSNISFSDGPATAFLMDENFTPQPPQKANTNLKYILIGVGALLAIVLVIVIIMMMVPKSSNSGSDDQSNNQGDGPTVAAKFSCEYTMKKDDLPLYYDAKSGQIVVDEEFNEDGMMVGYEQKITLEFADEDTADTVGVIMMADAESEYLGYGLSADPFGTAFSSGDSALIIKKAITIDSTNAKSISYYGIETDTTADQARSEFETAGYTCSVK